VTTPAEFQPIQITPGVQPAADRSAFATPHWTDAQHIRFRDGFPEKIGGWTSVTFDYGESLSGKVRTIYSAEIAENSQVVIGSHSNLYSLVGTRLVNITPLDTTPVAIANSLDNDYYSGVNTAFCTNGSNIVRMVDVWWMRYRVGDTITVSGFPDLANIPAAEINTTHLVRAVGDPYVDFSVSTTANATTSVTDPSTTAASGWMQVHAPAHGIPEGGRVKISGATDVGGVLAAEINAEHIVRNVTTDTFDIFTTGTATSEVTAGGGAATQYYPQIAAGDENEGAGLGYGMGLYGVGLYGTALVSSAARKFPRIWFADRYADTIIMTAGNQTGVYKWDGDTTIAPVALLNAPTACNYVFVSDNIVVTLGADGVPNKIKTSDQGYPENWTSSELNQVFEDNIEGAGRFVCHLPISGANLLFTNTQTWLFRKIDGNAIWSIELLDRNIGIISPRAGCVIGGVAYWQGRNNYYRWSGGNIEIVPSNTISCSTIWKHVYDNLTDGQRSKIHCWHNQQFDEIWWHYPSSGALEPDKVARLNISDATWVPDEFDRTASEYPNQIGVFPRLADSSAILYNHENGTDAGGVAMPWSLTSNRRGGGKYNALLSEVIPDSQQIGNITLRIDTQRYPQSSQAMFTKIYTVTPTTERVQMANGGRYWQYTLSGEELGQSWVSGQWWEATQRGAQQ